MKKILLIITILLIGINNVNAETINCNNTYKKGSTGVNVTYIQKALNDLGICSFTTSQYYGDTTVSCVKKLQKKYNLTEDGIVGKNTCNKLNTLITKKASTSTKNTASTVSTKSATTSTKSKTPLISSDSAYVTLNYNVLYAYTNSTNVRYLQKELNKVMNCSLDTDGYFGTNTKNCLIKFQKNNSLSQTGNADVNTVRALNKAYKYQTLLVKNPCYIKKNPSDSAANIKLLAQGNRVNIISQTTANNKRWYYVKYGNYYGYLKGSNTTDTFIEVDITSQTLRVYKYGALYLDTMVTTGKQGTNDTPKGYKTIIWRTTNHYMKEANVTVGYWLKLTSNGIGIHDANWRGNSESFTNFGGTVYKKSGTAGTSASGSHGCINTPLNKMKVIYDVSYEGMPVIIY